MLVAEPSCNYMRNGVEILDAAILKSGRLSIKDTYRTFHLTWTLNFFPVEPTMHNNSKSREIFDRQPPHELINTSIVDDLCKLRRVPAVIQCLEARISSVILITKMSSTQLPLSTIEMVPDDGQNCLLISPERPYFRPLTESAASGTTPDGQDDSLDTADSVCPRKLAEAVLAQNSPWRLAAEAILPESSSSWLADGPETEPNVATDLEKVRDEQIEFKDFDLGVDDLDSFDPKLPEVDNLPRLLRSNSDSSTMTDSSAFSKDLWAELACHMAIPDGEFGSDVSNDSTLIGNMDKYGVPIEDLDLEDIANSEEQYIMPDSPEVEMLDTSSLMQKKQAWTTMLPD
ncbi:hypothetical protein M758_1G063900 [Ceratodon purpureus]|nr:hypothetical protein M758_1G063900 [Ceratodon purpureus]